MANKMNKTDNAPDVQQSDPPPLELLPIEQHQEHQNTCIYWSMCCKRLEARQGDDRSRIPPRSRSVHRCTDEQKGGEMRCLETLIRMFQMG